MPMALLQDLAELDLPITLDDVQQIRKLRVLVTAGHVYATIPLPYVGLDGRWYQERATVHFITPLGYKVLRYFGPADKSATVDKDRGQLNPAIAEFDIASALGHEGTHNGP